MAQMPTAIVTGAANGIGRATAERLVADGFTVAGFDIEPIDVAGVHGVQCDISDIASFEAIVDSVEREHGPVEALANVAGIAVSETLAELTVEGYRRQLAVTLDGPIFLARAVGLRMAARSSGRIVNVTSVHAHHSEAAALAYGASKAGLMAATRVMAIELGPHGVLVNDVAPGFVRTRMSVVNGQNELDSQWFEDVYRRYGKLPLGRAAAPPEIAATIAHLLSPDNTYITGTSIRVDGGLMATF
jgi:NAD(P)-dependent dehydrogenase (short-subunit alcohol dehydrogenase family)